MPVGNHKREHPAKDAASIPAESLSPGKPISSKVHNAEGNRRFKEHVYS
jgi:hypothetical protein